MTDQDYDTVAEMATDTLKLIEGTDAEQKIINGMWAPLQLLYVEMAKRKEIIPMYDLSEEKKRFYWDKVKGLNMRRYKQIWIAQAIYLYDLITETTT